MLRLTRKLEASVLPVLNDFSNDERTTSSAKDPRDGVLTNATRTSSSRAISFDSMCAGDEEDDVILTGAAEVRAAILYIPSVFQKQPHYPGRVCSYLLSYFISSK
jgi:hypothetical protein